MFNENLESSLALFSLGAARSPVAGPVDQHLGREENGKTRCLHPLEDASQMQLSPVLCRMSGLPQ
jgi:hypothetical protein